MCDFRISDTVTVDYSCTSQDVPDPYVVLRLEGWCGIDKMMVSRTVPKSYVGGRHWPHIVEDMYRDMADTVARRIQRRHLVKIVSAGAPQSPF